MQGQSDELSDRFRKSPTSRPDEDEDAERWIMEIMERWLPCVWDEADAHSSSGASFGP